MKKRGNIGEGVCQGEGAGPAVTETVIVVGVTETIGAEVADVVTARGGDTKAEAEAGGAITDQDDLRRRSGGRITTKRSLSTGKMIKEEKTVSRWVILYIICVSWCYVCICMITVHWDPAPATAAASTGPQRSGEGTKFPVSSSPRAKSGEVNTFS